MRMFLAAYGGNRNICALLMRFKIMRIDSSGGFTSTREWFRSVLRGKDVVLSHTSALECLGLFPGYINENQIDVYATKPEPYENINWNLIDDLNTLDTVTIAGLRCTSVNQTINDMLRDYDRIDEQSFVEALSRYYYKNGASFVGLQIPRKYADKFNSIKDWAVEYYDYD
jgi:hypothetical protein